MSTTAPELFTTISNGWANAAQQWLDQSQRLWDQLGAPLRERLPGPSEPAPRHHRTCDCCGAQAAHHHDHDHHAHHDHGHHDHGGHGEHDHRGHGYVQHHDHEHHGCEHHHHEHREHPARQTCCGRCGSACCTDGSDSCLTIADVVVHARLGERRVVPLRLHNPWRREREVSLAVGPWHLSRGEDLVVVAVLEEEKLVLQPCEDRVVRLGLAVAATSDEDTNRTDEPSSAAHPEVSKRFVRDLDACASAYADLRFEGCARPLRIAVIVRPSDCAAVDVACDCGCC